ncbi:serine hydrolase domain-containing protein [Yeosuana sp.]|uniref:serine hydrolase domain-containing protein n=1 Tax=Yeosuana sp. TaxID=2529388 RepID=UPI00404B1252
MKKNSIIILILIFGTSISLFSQNKKKEKKIRTEIELYLKNQFENSKPGGAVLVSKKGKILLKEGYGIANMEWNIPVETNTAFQIGSVTKLFTALAVLQLAEENKLSLVDSVQKFIPSFPNKDYPITIEQLLTHTSGLKDYLTMNHPDPNIMRRDFNTLELIDFFKDEPLEFIPGSKSSYSNSGTFLLGHIIEKASGMSYQQYIENNVFKKAGMHNSYYGGNSKIIPNRATSYTIDGEIYKNGEYRSMTIPYSAGALISTVEDMYKWQLALFNNELLSKEFMTKATTRLKLNNGEEGIFGYGGWFVDYLDLNGSPNLAHSGGISAFNSFVIYLPNEDIFVVVLSNFKDANVQEIATDIATLAMGGALSSEIEIDKESRRNYLGRYQPIDGSSKNVEIKEIEGKLVFDMVGKFKLEIVQIEENLYSLKNAKPKATLKFIKDEKGKVQKLIVNQGGLYEWEKID